VVAASAAFSVRMPGGTQEARYGVRKASSRPGSFGSSANSPTAPTGCSSVWLERRRVRDAEDTQVRILSARQWKVPASGGRLALKASGRVTPGRSTRLPSSKRR
jgi:hypothetical protein